jgi:hypothetical protein
MYSIFVLKWEQLLLILIDSIGSWLASGERSVYQKHPSNISLLSALEKHVACIMARTRTNNGSQSNNWLSPTYSMPWILGYIDRGDYKFVVAGQIMDPHLLMYSCFIYVRVHDAKSKQYNSIFKTTACIFAHNWSRNFWRGTALLWDIYY